jgi:hypothetical protein
MEAMPPGAVKVKRFSCFQALEAGAQVAEEVSA